MTPQRPNVSRRAHLVRSDELFRRHVDRRADDPIGGRQRLRPGVGRRDRGFESRAIRVVVGGAEDLGESEIADPRLAMVVEQDVEGLEVAVQDFLIVGMLNGPRHLLDECGRSFRFHEAISRSGETAAGHQLHDEIGLPAMKGRLVHRDDVSVSKLRQNPSLLDETAGRVRLPRPSRSEGP